MSAAPTVAGRRQREKMSEPGDPSPSGAAVRVEDIERALVLAREVASATAGGGSANLRVEHLRALFANGNGRVDPERIQAALAAAGLRVDPPLSEGPATVSLRLDRRRATLSPKGGGAEPPPRPTGVAAYQAAAGTPPREKKQEPEAVSLGDAERAVAAEHSAHNTPQAIAALMPAMIVPVLAASFLGPLFGAAFAGLALLTSAVLSRPGALADGKLGPIRMPASLARSFLLVSFGVALGALLTSLALVAAGGRDTDSGDPNAPLEQTQPAQPTTTTPPAPPSAAEQQRQQEREREAAAERRAERRAAERRRERRERARERAREQDVAPPSGGGGAPAPAPAP